MSATFELVSCVVFYYSKFVGRPSYYTSLSIGLGNIPLVLVFAGIVMVGKTLTEWAAGLDGAAPTVMAYKVDQ